MIEVATFEDLEILALMTMNSPDDIGLDNLPELNLEKIQDYYFEQFKHVPIFVYREDDIIKGFVGMEFGQFWWSDEVILNEYIFYVHPNYRKIEIIEALVGAMVDFAKFNDKKIHTSFLSAKHTEAKRRVFEKKGFKSSGFIGTYGM